MGGQIRKTDPAGSIACVKEFRPGVVILGAGASSRMGRPKLLLAWAETTILAHSVAQWHAVGAEQIAVVCGPSPHPVFLELERLRDVAERIVNSAPEHGMFSSVQAAARWPNWRSEITHVAISLGDQPQIRESTIRTLLDYAAAHPREICQPSFRQRAKHPVILPRDLFAELSTTSVTSLRDFLELRGEMRSWVEIDDPGLALDIDTPADYAALINVDRGTV
jgi:molybdenum cofactor cytidylyltransferase